MARTKKKDFRKDVPQIDPKLSALNKADMFMDNWYDTYSSILLPYKKRIVQWHKLYKSIPDGRKSGLSNTFVPETFIDAEVLASDIMNLIFAQDPFFTAEPAPPEFEEHQRKMQELMWQLMLEGGFKRKILKGIRRTIVEGVLPGVVFFNKKVNLKGRDKVKNKAGKVKIVNKSRVIRNFPDFDIPEILDTILDPFIELEDAQGVQFKWNVNWETLQGLVSDERAEQELIDKIRVDRGQLEVSDKARQAEEKVLRERKQQDAGFNIPDTSNVRIDYELKVFFGSFPRWWVEPKLIDTEEGDEDIVGEILKVGRQTIGINENDFWDYEIPVIIGKLIELDNEVMGISPTGINERTQVSLNTTRDQEIDFKTISLYMIFIKNRQAGIFNEDLKIQPNGIIEVDGDVRAALTQLMPDPQAFQSGAITENLLKDDMRRVFSTNAPRQGLSSPGRQTASEVQTLQVRGGVRAFLMAMTFAETFIKPLLKKYWLLIKQNIKDKIMLKGKTVEYLSPDEIHGDYDWQPKILTDPMNVSTMRSTLLALMDSLGRVPTMAGKGIYNMGRKVYQLSGFKDVDVQFPPVPTEQWRLNPADENKIMEQGQVQRANDWEDHLAHIEAHIPSFQEEKNPTVKKIKEEHVKEHFAYTQVLEKLQSQVNLQEGITRPGTPGTPGTPPAGGGAPGGAQR